jgi:hypothetical protein
MNWWQIPVGYLVSVVGGAGTIHLILRIPWKRFYDKTPGKSQPPAFSLTMMVGCLERFLYTSAICIGAWEWIGIWVAVKVAVRWRGKSDNPDGSVDNIWLIGTALSIIFGFAGAWIILGKLPVKPNH